MNKRYDKKDLQLLSLYLDGQLSVQEKKRLESRIQASKELQEALKTMQRTLKVLKAAPKHVAPRNFTLTPEMVREKRSSLLLPLLSISSVAAAMLFAVLLVFEFFTVFSPMAGVADEQRDARAGRAVSFALRAR